MKVGLVLDSLKDDAEKRLQQTRLLSIDSIWFRDLYPDSKHSSSPVDANRLDPFLFIAFYRNELQHIERIGFSVVRLDRTSPENLVRILVSLANMFPTKQLRIGLGWEAGLSQDARTRDDYMLAVEKTLEQMDFHSIQSRLSFGIIDCSVYRSISDKFPNSFYITTDPTPANLRELQFQLGKEAKIVLDLFLKKKSAEDSISKASFDENTLKTAQNALIKFWCSFGVDELILSLDGLKIWCGNDG